MGLSGMLYVGCLEEQIMLWFESVAKKGFCVVVFSVRAPSVPNLRARPSLWELPGLMQGHNQPSLTPGLVPVRNSYTIVF